ncbi:DUF881 domain-containing protein [Streptomyces sp. Z26]|uniref:DUF881 domain-containing protein n=1 Tax=Streptomyces sp. Z26 TaxID=2500177 RepID=UPI000EF1421D|nr:DUF881 domain-containing protein [Streptomyces sp. Z26]RLL69997.1 DUF881 domain-containing protein [Streptomyces sp. Z26]
MSDENPRGVGGDKRQALPAEEPARDAHAAASADRGGAEPAGSPGRPGSHGAPGHDEHAGRDERAAGEAVTRGSDEEPEGALAPEGGDEPGVTGRQRLAAALWPPRVTRAQLTVAVLLFVLGLGLAIQVRSTSEGGPLRGARQEDLVRILDELDDRSARLQGEKQRLEGQQRELENSSDQAEEARRQTRQKARQLGVLAGTVGAEGPGLHITVRDPGGAVEADMLLDTIQELRAAGAEAIEVNDVRVVASSYLQGATDVRIDGKAVAPPYRFEVIGEPKDLEPALNIPGGVVQTLEKEQAGVEVSRSEKITVDALRSTKQPDYARSSQ